MVQTSRFHLDAKRFFFLYGKTLDEFCLADGCCYKLAEVLFLHLKQLGYERILFYNGRNKLYFYDYRSRDLLWRQQGGREKTDESNQQGRVIRPRSKIMAGPLGNKKLLGEENRGYASHNSQQGNLQPENEQNNQTEGLIFPESSDEGIVNILDSCMRDTAIKTAVIFTDGVDFITYTTPEALRQMAGTLRVWEEEDVDNENLCLMIFPDIARNEMRELIERNSHWHFLLSLMFESGNSPSSATFHIDSPRDDELWNLVQHIRLRQGRLIKQVEVPNIVTLLRLAMQHKMQNLKDIHLQLNRCSDCSLRGIAEHLNMEEQLDFIEEHKQYQPLFTKEGAVALPLRIASEKEIKREPFSEQGLREVLGAVKNQDDNIALIGTRISTWMVQQKERPLNFFMVGSSGTGKTFTVKRCSEQLKLSGYKFVRFDMNEYGDESKGSNLIGSATGYVGSTDEPRLFSELRENDGKLLLLFDEIEKAHSSILIKLMNLLDEGRLAWQDKEYDFRECLVFFTSNLLQEEMIAAKQQWIAQGKEYADRDFINSLRDKLRYAGFLPEICGRLDNFLVYDRLPTDGVIDIALQELRELGKSFGLHVHLAAPELLAEAALKCSDSMYGARDIKGLLQDRLAERFAAAKNAMRDKSDKKVDIIKTADGYIAKESGGQITQNFSDKTSSKKALLLVEQEQRKLSKLNQKEVRDGLSRIFGQDDCLDYICAKLREWYSTQEKKAPLSFFVAGDSGVGKTETALLLSEALKNYGYGLYTVDLNTFKTAEKANNLLGSATGYVGSDTEPEIFRKLRESNGHLIIVFNEYDKAHPDIITQLMEMLDKGALSWSKGTGNFTQCIIFFTSNLFREKMQALKQSWIAQGGTMTDPQFQDAVTALVQSGGTAAEICGRVNHYLVYNSLTADAGIKIGSLVLSDIAKNYGIQLYAIAPELLVETAVECLGSDQGARHVKKILENKTAALFLDFTEDNPDKTACDLIYEQGEYKVIVATETAVDRDMIIERANSLYQSTYLKP